jgi:membrane protease YdiL (CAAX protease family)
MAQLDTKPQTSAEKPALLIRVFISPDENRLRSGWRLLFHFILWIVLSVLAEVLVLSLVPNEIPFLSQLGFLLPLTFLSFLATTFSVLFARKLLDRRSFTSLGLDLSRSPLKDILTGFLISGVLMLFIFLVVVFARWGQVSAFIWTKEEVPLMLINLLLGLAVMFMVGWYEELFSRGYQLVNFTEGLNRVWGVVLSSLVFSLLHLINPYASLYSVVGIFLAGVFLAYACLRTGELWLAIGLHAGWNFFQGSVFGFPVSGLGLNSLINMELTGPELLTGGFFGPEAGLILIPTLALGFVLVHIYTLNRSPDSSSDSKVEY